MNRDRIRTIVIRIMAGFISILLIGGLWVSLDPFSPSVEAQPQHYRALLEQAVAAKHWSDALDLIDQLIILQPEHRSELEAYRQQIQSRQEQAASTQGLSSPPEQGFDLTLRFVDERFSESQRDAITRAARRWEEVVVGDLEEYPLGIAASRCSRFIRQGTPAYDRPIDDILVDFLVSGAKDPGKQLSVGFLARALDCVQRGNGSTVYGVVQFEETFMQADSGSELFYQVSLHELGHILGLVPGSAQWQRGTFTDSPTYIGPQGVEAYRALGGHGDIPLQSCYGGNNSQIRDCGSAHSHWDYRVLAGEVMTDGGAISRISVGALVDLGYEVDWEAADPFILRF